jgi:hypothetical protein
MIELDRQAMGEATYCVVFYESQGLSTWWTKWISKRYAHVEVWWHLGDDYWVAIRPNYCYMTCDVMHGAPRVGDNGVSQFHVVKALRKRTSPMFPLGMKTCVAVVKAVIGLRAAWVVTPRQLQHYLSKKAVI